MFVLQSPVRANEILSKRVKSRIHWLGYRLAELEQETAGVIASRSMRESAKKTLGLHLEDYLADLRAQGRDGMYIYNLEKRLVKLWEECGWKTLRDITADSFQAWRARQDKAAKTVNDYLDAKGAFLKWMVRNEGCAANQLVMADFNLPIRCSPVSTSRACT